MHIEIRGTNFLNKGAELMLLAILDKVRGAYPGASMVMRPRFETYLKRAKLLLWQKMWLHKYGVQWGSIGKLIPRRLRRRYGLILDQEVDFVLDAWGFRYSDQFGDKPTLRMAHYVKTWKRRGTKVVLLPQALGPFTSRSIRRAFASIVANADLVFPRDEVSYRHVLDIVGERANVIQAPDFTNLLPGTPPHSPERFEGRLCLVPNVRMLDKTSPEDGRLYRELLARCVKCIVELGQKPLFIIHEGEEDLALAKSLATDTGQEVEIIQEEDALKTKGILGTCAGVIGSRFHALVSSLSQGTPVLATGWSHKYEMLLNDYAVPDSLVALTCGPDELKKRIDALVDSELRIRANAALLSASAKLKRQAEAMWEKVLSLMSSELRRAERKP